MTRLTRRIGGVLLLLAFALFTAIVIHPFALGGAVWGGKVEDGRYFVVSKGHRYTEVSEAQWRIEQYFECSFPWLPVVLVWIGLAFRDASDTQEKPGPQPSAEPQKLTVFLGVVGVGGTAFGALVGWVITGVPWTVVLRDWLV